MVIYKMMTVKQQCCLHVKYSGAEWCITSFLHTQCTPSNVHNIEIEALSNCNNFGCMKVAIQRAKKVVSDSLGLRDFAIGLMNFVLNLPDGQVKCFEEFKLLKNCEINSAHQNVFGAS